jgi:nucleotide-binding universal stress UspA family protein
MRVSVVVTEPMAPVVVGLDGSPASLYALDLAADEALGRVTPLDVVYVREEIGGQPVRRDLLACATQWVRDDHPGLAVRGTFVIGDPAGVLLRHAGEASLLVLGHSAAAGQQLGPVAARVAAGSVVPVLVSRPFDRAHVPAHPRPVLVGVADLAESDTVVAFAFEEAALRGAPVQAYHVESGSASGERLLAEAVAGWSAKYPEVEVSRVVVPAVDVATVLLAASHDAQLVVLGRRARAHAGPVVLGDVCRVLLAGAGCSVAVVPRH